MLKLFTVHFKLHSLRDTCRYLPCEYKEDSNSNFSYICKVPWASVGIAEHSKEQVGQLSPRVRVQSHFTGKKRWIWPILSFSIQLNLVPTEVNGNHILDFRWGSWACMRPWHAKLMLWKLVGTSYPRALSHKCTFTNSTTSIGVSLWKQTSSCGKETFPCNFHPPQWPG